MKSLIVILELSVKKHGKDKPITIGHLLNITKMAYKHKKTLEALSVAEHKKILKDIDPLGQDGGH